MVPRSLQRAWDRFYHLFRGIESPSDRDILLLTPFHLYKKYHHFPVKVALHLILIIFISANALLMSSQYIKYNRANEQTFESIFLSEDLRSAGLYSIPEVLDLISSTVEKYYTFPAVALRRYAHLLEPGGQTENDYDIIPLHLTISRYENLEGTFWTLPCPFSNSTNETEAAPTESSIEFEEYSYLISIFDGMHIETSEYSITDDEFQPDELIGDFSEVTEYYDLTLNDKLGPLSLTLGSCELQKLFYSIKEISLSFSYRAVNLGVATVPYFWDVDILLSPIGGQILPTIVISHRISNVVGFSSDDVFGILNVVLFALSLLSMALALGSIIQNVRIFKRTQKLYRYYSSAAIPGDHFPSWTSLPMRLKPQFVSMWAISNFFGSFLLLCSCVTSVLEQNGINDSDIHLILYGLGCLLTCFGLLRYFEYFPLLYLHVQTLRHAGVHVITYLLSVMPIYWAFVIFGVLNFGPYSVKFMSVSRTIVTLFSLLNGDDIYETFQEIEDGQYPVPAVSRIYIIAFVTLFVTSVLNVFIFIIEDSYRKAKMNILRRNDVWDPLLHSDADGSDYHFNPREIMLIVFYNIDLWKQRMTESPEAYGIAPFVPCESANDFTVPHYNESSKVENSGHAILLDQFPCDEEEIVIQKQNEEQKSPIRMRRRNQTASVPHLFYPNKQTIVAKMENCKGDVYSLVCLLQAQLASNRSLLSEQIQRRDAELEVLQQQIQEQETIINELCKQIMSSSDQRPYEIL